MVLHAAGSIGIGLVWGWLTGSLEGRVRAPLRTLLSVTLATFLAAATVFGFQGWRGLVFFFAAALLAFVTHIAWRRHLRSKISSRT